MCRWGTLYWRCGKEQGHREAHGDWVVLDAAEMDEALRVFARAARS